MLQLVLIDNYLNCKQNGLNIENKVKADIQRLHVTDRPQLASLQSPEPPPSGL